MLHDAAHKRNNHIIKLLLEKGADPEAKDNNGLTVLQVAVERGEDKSIIRLLQEHKKSKLSYPPNFSGRLTT